MKKLKTKAFQLFLHPLKLALRLLKFGNCIVDDICDGGAARFFTFPRRGPTNKRVGKVCRLSYPILKRRGFLLMIRSVLVTFFPLLPPFFASDSASSRETRESRLTLSPSLGDSMMTVFCFLKFEHNFGTILKAPCKGPLEKFLNEMEERFCKEKGQRQNANGIPFADSGGASERLRKVATCKTNSKDPRVKPRFSLVVAFGPLLLNPFGSNASSWVTVHLPAAGMHLLIMPIQIPVDEGSGWRWRGRVAACDDIMSLIAYMPRFSSLLPAFKTAVSTNEEQYARLSPIDR